MNMPVLSQMEDSISRLSLAEQLWLMERLVQRIKEKTTNQKSQFEQDLINALRVDSAVTVIR
jgi:hypothetical protein